MNCLYCGNPNPTVQVQRWQSTSRGMNFSLSYPLPSNPIPTSVGFNNSNQRVNVTINDSLHIKCLFCGREYLVLADTTSPSLSPQEVQSQSKFIRDTLNIMEFKNEEDIALEIAEYGITEDNFRPYAITVPLKFKNKIRQRLSDIYRRVGFEFHILFKSNNQNFYFICYRYNNTGRIIATHVEKAK